MMVKLGGLAFLGFVAMMSCGGAPTAISPSPDNPNRAYQLRDLQKETLKIGTREVEAWIMDTEGKRAEGMMFLREPEVKDHQGMLFVFAEAQPLSFWMRNTYLPLDIAFITADKRILNIEKGTPLSLDSVPSAGPCKYVLEMKQGQMAKQGIVAGMTIEIPSTVVAKDAL